MTNKTIAATRAKTQFAELIDLARKEPVTITRNNRPVAVVLSPEEYTVLNDTYWVQKTKEAEKDADFLSAEDTAIFMNQLSNGKA
jgi:prevent-host-death family protein